MSTPQLHHFVPVPGESLTSTEIYANAYVEHPLYTQNNFQKVPSENGLSYELPNYQAPLGYAQGYAVFQALVNANSSDPAIWRQKLLQVLSLSSFLIFSSVI